MEQYRKAIKEHFESKSGWRALLKVDFLFWGGGIVLSSLGGAMSATSYPAASTLNALGGWALLFGLALAFIRKNDWGLMIGTAGIALENVAMIIVQALRGVVGYGTIFDAIAYGLLFAAVLLTSDVMKQAKENRLRQAELRARQQPPVHNQFEAGAFCTSCGAPHPVQSRFCPQCGTRIPPQEAVSPQQQRYPQAPEEHPNAAQNYDASPSKKRNAKIALIAVIAVVFVAVVVLGIIALTGGFGGAADADYYEIGSDRIPSVSLALNESRKVHSSGRGNKNGLEIYSVVYNVSGNRQGDDISEYFEYLCANDSFTMRDGGGAEAFSGSSGTAQVWRNSQDAGYMVVVQADFDAKGYTITVMYGEAQVTGAATPSSALPTE